MSKKLTRHGNSYALIIKPIEASIVAKKQSIKKIVDEIMKKYADAFKKLAKQP